jgi:hypothetical protein
MTASTILLNAASGAAGDPLFVENVFSTFVYDGTNDNNHRIRNGIDLSGEGGLVWIKSRDVSRNHALYDTERGVNKYLSSNTTSAQTDLSSSNDQGVKAFNSNGFTMDDDALVNANDPGLVSWTFRKAPKFFDIQTWSGDNSTNRSISHNINGTVGSIFVKRTNGTDSWYCYHRGIGETKTVFLESTLQAYTRPDWGNTAPTSSAFTVNGITNTTGYDYVAYLFAHNNSDGGYGDDADQDIIKCGSYTGNGSGTGPVVDLGFEPQWVVIKNASSTGPWVVLDTMRGWPVTNDTTYTDHMLWWNTSDAEYTSVKRANPTSTGFQIRQNNSQVNTNGNTYVYMAIRRGPMATPETAPSVFHVGLSSETGSTAPEYYSGFVVDMAIKRIMSASQPNYIFDRLRGGNSLRTDTTAAESGFSSAKFDYMDGYYDGTSSSTSDWSAMWRRAPGYFDVVAYTGNGTSNRALTHGLGVTPEMIWVKARNIGFDWVVKHKDLGRDELTINANTAAGGMLGANFWGTGTDTATAVYLAESSTTVAGVSKVGSVTHSGTTNVDCGFSSGAKFVLLKRTDSAGNWFVWDSIRGIVAGNDPYFLLNTNGAPTTSDDYIDPLSSGFTITDDFTDGTYIFYAIAAS